MMGVEAHGGRITVLSEVGRGTTFSVDLPCEAAGHVEPIDRRWILLVEDDDNLRELFAEALQDEGYAVEVAHDGLDALGVIEVRRPALILLDWMMPRMDGPTLVAELRKRGIYPGVPVVLLTAGVHARQRAMECGVDAYLGKPFDLDALLDIVARFLGRDPGEQGRVAA